MLLRILLMVAEYGGLFFGAVVFYLLNFRPVGLSESRLNFREFLSKWIEFRKKKEKHPATEIVISTLTIVSAVTVVPFASRLWEWVRNLWFTTVVAHRNTAAQIAAIAAVIIVAYALYLLRKWSLKTYAYLEILVGLMMTFAAVGFLEAPEATPNVSLAGAGVPLGLRVMAAVYVMIRGWVNLKTPVNAKASALKTA
jgi:hypothetical protein